MTFSSVLTKLKEENLLFAVAVRTIAIAFNAVNAATSKLNKLCQAVFYELQITKFL